MTERAASFTLTTPRFDAYRGASTRQVVGARRLRLGHALGRIWLYLVIAFVYAPIIVVVGASVDPGQAVGLSSFLQFPPHGFSLHWYGAIRPELWAALWFSTWLAAVVAAAALVIAIPAALGLARGEGRWLALAETAFRAPLQIPFIVTAIAFLQTYYVVAARFGLGLPGSLPGLFLGHLFVATPYTIGSLTVVLRRMDRRLEEAAMSLGAPYGRVLLRVTLPLAMPGIYGGVIYAFLVSFTDVTISVFLAGPGRTPLPVWIFNSLSQDLDPSVPAISTLVFLGFTAAVYLLQRLLGMDAILRSSGNSG
jgi:putative spermidine/putrescine transport system permease protein